MILNSLQAKSQERQWVRHQTSGELDDSKLIEGNEIEMHFVLNVLYNIFY